MKVYTLKPVGHSEELKPYVARFEDDASFRMEILPHLMKCNLMSSGSIMWVDAGVQISRGTIASNTANLMVPICNSNTSIHEGVADKLEMFICRLGSIVVFNSAGEKFELSRTNEFSPNKTLSESSNISNSISEIPVRSDIKPCVVKRSSPKDSCEGFDFASDGNHCHRHVKSSL